MANLQTNYQALTTDESENQDSVVFHVASEGRWNHVGDLDTFFRQIYDFHQKHGFYCILFEMIRSILVTFFIWVALIYCPNCIYFNFDESPITSNNTNVQFGDLFIPFSQCVTFFTFGTWLIVLGGIVVLVYQLYKVLRSAYAYKEIEQFFTTAMRISKADINNITWHEVQCRLRDVQHEQQMCVHKSDLTELDIYHRILRNKNYMVALVNKNILPLKYNVKFIGEWVYLSSFLEANLDFILFRSGSSPFKNSGALRDDYKKYSKRKELAAELSRSVLLLGVGNLCLCPLILVYQFLSFFIAYSGSVRYEPALLGVRRWSPYARLHLRHFNELEHEMQGRLSRAYKPAHEYMKSFSSPLLVSFAKFFKQIVGAVVVSIGIWGLFKERLLLMDYVLLTLTSGAFVYYCFAALIPDENIMYFPSHLMQRIVAEVHYAPDHFKTKAHTSTVREEFSQLFPSTMVHLIEELLSPLLTPYVLIFHLRHRALDIVDFFRNFTVDVEGVGDVCSFALMDVARHGDRQWNGQMSAKADQCHQAEDGKTELSLIHFTMMNPQWEPPHASNVFINDFRDQVASAREKLPGIQENALYASLNSISTIGSKYASLVQSIHQSVAQSRMERSASTSAPEGATERPVMSGGVHLTEGPPTIGQGSILGSMTNEPCELNPLEMRAADMSLSALFLHEVHDRNVAASRHQDANAAEDEEKRNEESLLLDVRR